MKVLHVSSYYYPHLGGMESTVAQICKGLTRHGYLISIYSSKDPLQGLSSESQNGLEIRRFNVIAKPMLNPITRGLFSEIMRSDAKIVHAHDEHSFTSNLAVTGRILRDRPLVLHCHGELAAVSLREQMIIDLYDSTLNRAGYHIADIVIQVSPAFIPYVTRKFGISAKKIRVVTNAIDPDNYFMKANPDEFSREKNLPEAKWIIYVGSLINRKGVQTLIGVLPEIIREEPETRLLIVGRGPLKSQLLDSVSQRRLSKHVFFLDGLSQLELSAAYRLSKLLVLPTLADVAPTVILEAMLLRRPVISSDILGIREFFSDTALLIKPRNSPALTEAVLRLLRDEDFAARLGEVGNKLVVKNFRWEERIETIAKIYDSLL